MSYSGGYRDNGGRLNGTMCTSVEGVEGSETGRAH